MPWLLEMMRCTYLRQAFALNAFVIQLKLTIQHPMILRARGRHIADQMSAIAAPQSINSHTFIFFITVPSKHNACGSV